MTMRTPRRNSTEVMWCKQESADNAPLHQTMKIQNPATDKENATEHTMPARKRNPSNEDMLMQSK